MDEWKPIKFNLRKKSHEEEFLSSLDWNDSITINNYKKNIRTNGLPAYLNSGNPYDRAKIGAFLYEQEKRTKIINKYYECIEKDEREKKDDELEWDMINYRWIKKTKED